MLIKTKRLTVDQQIVVHIRLHMPSSSSVSYQKYARGMTTKTMTAIEMKTMYHTCDIQSVHGLVMIIQPNARNADLFEDVFRMKVRRR
jgi:hypothetical protein